MNLENIRNFAIISHIDHGKSTLADRFLELTGTVAKQKMREQFLDSMELEREKGITIKMRPVRMIYNIKNPNVKIQMSNKIQNPNDQNFKQFENYKIENSLKIVPTSSRTLDEIGENCKLKISSSEYILNLIDTPGHTDFSYEVSRAMAAAEGAVLLVDATQGVQAQTLANVELAKKLNLKLIGAVNKIDLKEARIEETKKEIANLLNCKKEDILEISAKVGTGVEKLIEEIVKKVPCPKVEFDGDSPRALIFDFEYSAHRGIIAFIRVFDGVIKKDEELYLNKAGVKFKAKEIGYLSPDYAPQEKILSGEIGYIATSLKEPSVVKVGDTIISVSSRLAPLSGYKEPKPVIWSNFFPSSQADFEELKRALMKLALNDSSFSFEEIYNPSVGRGFCIGFLGMLHLEIISERLKREFKIETVNTLPSVVFLVKYKNGTEKKIYSANDFPEDFQIASVAELWVKAEILTPDIYLGAITKILKDYEGIVEGVENFSAMGDGKNRLIMKISMPIRELMRGFFDRLKSVSSGYASFNYEMDETEANWKEAAVARLDILINEEEVSALSRIAPEHRLNKEAEEMAEKLKKFLPAALYVLKIQAKANGRIIASRSISALKKNVTGYLYGGDRTRKMKLWQKQKKGKEKLREKSHYSIPSDVFLKVMK